MLSNLTPYLPKDVNSLSSFLEKEDHIFSYALNIEADGCLNLYQQETTNCLKITMHKKFPYIKIKNFSLDDKKELEEESESLYDAAIIEIVLVGLNLIYLQAQQEQMDEIDFDLCKQDYNHLSSFETFFQLLYDCGNKIAFIMSATQEAYALFRAQSQIVFTKIRRELWQRQREDKLLRCFLQENLKPSAAPLDFSQKHTDKGNNIIAFPQKKF